MAFEARLVHGDVLMVDHTPAGAIAAGQVVVLGAQVRIAHRDIPAGELGALAAEGGVYEIPKQGGAGVTFADGADVFWDDVNNRASVNNGGGANKRLGTAAGAAADADVTMRVHHLTN